MDATEDVDVDDYVAKHHAGYLDFGEDPENDDDPTYHKASSMRSDPTYYQASSIRTDPYHAAASLRSEPTYHEATDPMYHEGNFDDDAAKMRQCGW